MRIPFGRRGVDAVEWLDEGRGTSAELARCYTELEMVNRRLGGYRATFDTLAPWLAGRAPVSVLDVAGGDGGFALRFAAGHAASAVTRVCVLDRSRATLRLARRRLGPSSWVVGGDARALPFATGAFDVVHSATFFHHLSTLEACDVLAEMCRVARRLVVVNDLVRSPAAWLGFWGISRALSRSRMVRHDGPLSVRKAFVPTELAAIARFVGATAAPSYGWHLARRFPYRMTLIGARSDPGNSS